MAYEFCTDASPAVVALLVGIIIGCSLAIGYTLGFYLGKKKGLKQMNEAAEYIAKLMEKWKKRSVISFQALIG